MGRERFSSSPKRFMIHGRGKRSGILLMFGVIHIVSDFDKQHYATVGLKGSVTMSNMETALHSSNFLRCRSTSTGQAKAYKERNKGLRTPVS